MRCAYATGITGCRSSRCSNFDRWHLVVLAQRIIPVAVPKYSELSIRRGADHSPMLIESSSNTSCYDGCLLSGTAGNTRCRSETFGAVDPSRRRLFIYSDPLLFAQKVLRTSVCCLAQRIMPVAVPKYSELSILRGADHSPMLIQS